MEGFKEKPYQCQAGHWTNGFGHRLGVTADSAPVTIDQAISNLKDDLNSLSKWIARNILVKLTQNEFNALSSFIFNEGEGNVRGSELMGRLNAGDKVGASKQFTRWIYYTDPETKQKVVSIGLLERRQKEQTLFLTDINAAKNPTDLKDIS